MVPGFDEGMRKIPTIPPPRSTLKACRDPFKVIYEDQLKVLDPTGARKRLFSKDNPDRVHPGDILLVRLKNGDDFAGVCLNIRQRNSHIDTSILLRNHLTRLAVEMQFKVYSPNVEGIEIVQRRAKRARRAKLYYMRKPKHDIGSVDGIVRQYQRQKVTGNAGSKGVKGRDTNSHKKKNKRR
jgi:ribosomal protein L19